MTDHIKVEESYVDALIKNAAWSQLHLDVISEGADKGDKSKDKPEDKPDFTTDARKGDKSKTKPGQKDDENLDLSGGKFADLKDDDDEMKESTEVHTCPLCESTLEEELSDAKIYEHVAQIQAALLSIEENGEDSPEAKARAEKDAKGDSDFDGDDDDDEPDYETNDSEYGIRASKKSKKEAIMKKVKELKKSVKKGK